MQWFVFEFLFLCFWFGLWNETTLHKKKWNRSRACVCVSFVVVFEFEFEFVLVCVSRESLCVSRDENRFLLLCLRSIDLCFTRREQKQKHKGNGQRQAQWIKSRTELYCLVWLSPPRHWISDMLQFQGQAQGQKKARFYFKRQRSFCSILCFLSLVDIPLLLWKRSSWWQKRAKLTKPFQLFPNHWFLV